MLSRASQTLARAYKKRGVQRDHSKRTGIPQGTLSRLAKGALETEPTGEVTRKLQADPEIPIDPSWWREAPLADGEEEQGAA